MVTRRRQQFVIAHVSWMLATVLALSLLDAVSLELFLWRDGTVTYSAYPK